MTVLTVLAIIYEVLKLIMLCEIVGFTFLFLFISPNQWKEIKQKREAKKSNKGGKK